MNLDDMPLTLAFGAEISATYAPVIGDDPNWACMRDNCARFCTTARHHCGERLGAGDGGAGWEDDLSRLNLR